LIRPSIRFASVLALVAFSLPALQAAAQQDLPSAPAAAATASTTAATPNAPVLAAKQFPMPKPIPANFTAASPTKEAVDAFLKTSLGQNESRIWQVWAIEKSAAEGVSIVTVLVNDKSETQKPIGIEFYAMPDGKHFLIRSEKGMVLLPADAPQTPPAASAAANVAPAPAKPESAVTSPAATPFPTTYGTRSCGTRD